MLSAREKNKVGRETGGAEGGKQVAVLGRSSGRALVGRQRPEGGEAAGCAGAWGRSSGSRGRGGPVLR